LETVPINNCLVKLPLISTNNVNINIEGYANEGEMAMKLSGEVGLKFVGEFVYPNGSVYKGQMRTADEARHGYGVQLWPDGAKYEG
jgi:hypothetical protein